MAGLATRDLGVHRAGVDDRALTLGSTHIHLGDERQGLVGLALEILLDALPLGGEVGIGSQRLELSLERGLGRLIADADRG